MSRTTILYAFCLISLLIWFEGCVKLLPQDDSPAAISGVPPGIDPEEMHQWTPPSEAELEQRRQRQQELDALTAEIENLLLKFNQIDVESNNTRVGARTWDPKLEELDRRLSAEIAALDKKNREMAGQAAALSQSVDQAGKNVQTMQAAEAARRYQPGQYQSAYILFRDRKYAAAAQHFLQVLHTRYPADLRDNILFGLGASYFKLGKWNTAAKYLDTLVTQEKQGEKWHEASLLLGLVYNRSGQRSRALYVLENAIKVGPPAGLRPLIENLIAHTQEGNGLGRS